MEPAAQFRNLPRQGTGLVGGHAQHATDLMGNLFRLLAQDTAGFGQVDPDLSLILPVARATDMAGALKALQKRGQSAGVQKKPFADLPHGEFVLFPEHQQNHVLRVSQAEGLQELRLRLANLERLIRLARLLTDVGAEDGFDELVETALAEIGSLEWLARVAVFRVVEDVGGQEVERPLRRQPGVGERLHQGHRHAGEVGVPGQVLGQPLGPLLGLRRPQAEPPRPPADPRRREEFHPVLRRQVAQRHPELPADELVADVLFRDYLLPFEIVSVLLLVAVVGSVVMAKKRI